MLLNNYRAKKIISGTAIVSYCNLKQIYRSHIKIILLLWSTLFISFN